MPMYNLIEYKSNHSETAGILRFYSKDDFNNDIANTNNYKSFKYKAKSLGNAVPHSAANQANGKLKNATIAVPLNYLSNFWRLLEIPSINCKVQLTLRWTKDCVLSVLGSENDHANANNITFTIKDRKLYVPVFTLSAKDNQKLSKLLSKGFERSVYWNEYKTKNENKSTANGYFIESNFVGVKKLFVLSYPNHDDNAKRTNGKKYYLPKRIIKNFNVIINGGNSYNQIIDSNIKQYEETIKLTTGQGEDSTTGCLLDY